jgi:hypothetical protein
MFEATATQRGLLRQAASLVLRGGGGQSTQSWGGVKVLGDSRRFMTVSHLNLVENPALNAPITYHWKPGEALKTLSEFNYEVQVNRWPGLQSGDLR